MKRSFGGLLILASFASPSAYAKKVSLEWKEIKGAKSYEIQVRRAGEVVVKKSLDDHAWSGDLGFGVFAYQIRAVDRVGRPGQWSSAKALVVAPKPPEQEFPKNGNKVILYDPKAPVLLSWEAVEGASKYAVVVKQGKKQLQKLAVQGTKASVRGLEVGSFTWHVAAIIEATDREPAALRGKVWESPYSDEEEFEVELRQLAKVEPIFPLGVIPPSKDGKLQFEWKKVDGAEAYEVEVSELTPARAPASATGPLPKSKTFVTRDRGMTIPVGLEGFGSWKVRALANVDPENVPGAAGPHSAAEYRVNRNAQFSEGSGYIALSTLFSPYSMRMEIPGGEVRNASSNAGTLRLSGEYYFVPQWAIGAGIEMTQFGLAARHQIFSNIRQDFDLNRKTFELTAKYRMAISRDRYGWFLAARGGLEYRDYYQVRSEGSSAANAHMVSDQAGVFGPALGVDIRKQLTDKLSLGAKISYFLPISISRLSASNGDTYELQLSGQGHNRRNLSFGLQGMYWLGPRWGVGAGAYAEMRSLGYDVTASDSSGATQGSITQDAFHFFGSLLYSFGR
jgi:hypothetical protein